MSILVDRDIRRAIDYGDICIDPFDPKSLGQEAPVNTPHVTKTP
jgi:hypothetical protein